MKTTKSLFIVTSMTLTLSGVLSPAFANPPEETSSTSATSIPQVAADLAPASFKCKICKGENPNITQAATGIQAGIHTSPVNTNLPTIKKSTHAHQICLETWHRIQHGQHRLQNASEEPFRMREAKRLRGVLTEGNFSSIKAEVLALASDPVLFASLTSDFPEGLAIVTQLIEKAVRLGYTDDMHQEATRTYWSEFNATATRPENREFSTLYLTVGATINYDLYLRGATISYGIGTASYNQHVATTDTPVVFSLGGGLPSALRGRTPGCQF